MTLYFGNYLFIYFCYSKYSISAQAFLSVIFFTSSSIYTGCSCLGLLIYYKILSLCIYYVEVLIQAVCCLYGLQRAVQDFMLWELRSSTQLNRDLFMGCVLYSGNTHTHTAGCHIAPSLLFACGPVTLQASFTLRCWVLDHGLRAQISSAVSERHQQLPQSRHTSHRACTYVIDLLVVVVVIV